MRSFIFPLLLFFALAHPLLADETRQSIETAYAKSYKAAALKYLPGMTAFRAPDFVAYGKKGEKIDLEQDLAALRTLTQQALKIEESGEIVSFEKLSSGEVECVVADELRLTMLDPKTEEEMQVLISTRSQDIWAQTKKGWKQVSTRVLEQTVNRLDKKAK